MASRLRKHRILVGSETPEIQTNNGPPLLQEQTDLAGEARMRTAELRPALYKVGEGGRTAILVLHGVVGGGGSCRNDVPLLRDLFLPYEKIRLSSRNRHKKKR